MDEEVLVLNESNVKWNCSDRTRRDRLNLLRRYCSTYEINSRRDFSNKVTRWEWSIDLSQLNSLQRSLVFGIIHGDITNEVMTRLLQAGELDISSILK